MEVETVKILYNFPISFSELPETFQHKWQFKTINTKNENILLEGIQGLDNDEKMYSLHQINTFRGYVRGMTMISLEEWCLLTLKQSNNYYLDGAPDFHVLW